MYPKLIEIGPITINSYPALFVLGAVFILFVALGLLKKEGFPSQEIVRLFVICYLFMLVGGVFLKIIYFSINSFDMIKNDPLYLLRNFFGLGTMFFGALVGYLVFILFYVRPKHPKNFLLLADVSAIGVALGQVFGRIGCFLTGCCYGRPSPLPWAMNFKHIGDSIHPYYGTKIHPTQLYEAGLNLINFALLYWIFKKKGPSGLSFALYLVNYGVIRFFLEYLRADVKYIIEGSSPLLSLTIIQVLCLGLILMGAYRLVLLHRK
ncbi:MAG: prolipoprotein diacylglyceryl transferase [Candidatus Aminicenantes bacterium]|nr:prolipoprotein diacylglyceryl transferase [Candidatus Aminicenantes bacterium]